jgi:hypothetical protein
MKKPKDFRCKGLTTNGAVVRCNHAYGVRIPVVEIQGVRAGWAGGTPNDLRLMAAAIIDAADWLEEIEGLARCDRAKVYGTKKRGDNDRSRKKK